MERCDHRSVRKIWEPEGDLMLLGRVHKRFGKNTVYDMGLEKLLGVCYAKK